MFYSSDLLLGVELTNAGAYQSARPRGEDDSDTKARPPGMFRSATGRAQPKDAKPNETQGEGKERGAEVPWVIVTAAPSTRSIVGCR